jgi:hypothetical protein
MEFLKSFSIKTCFLFLLLTGACALYLFTPSRRVQIQPPTPSLFFAVNPEPVKIEETVTDYLGEKITYNIKMGLTNLGRAYFTNLRKAKLRDQQVNIITFETNVIKFHDVETIYTDPVDFLPLRVERDIRAWPKYEKIIEEYDPQKCSLTITKAVGKKKDVLVIKKDSPLHNAILLPYFVRRIKKLDIGWHTKINLPTQEFDIKLVSLEDIEVPAGKFKTFYFESTPSRFNIWITADDRRIPVKMKGMGALGYTMMMRSYEYTP